MALLMLQRAARIVVICTAAAGLVACGDDALTKEEFIAAADEICKEAEERTEDLKAPTTPEEIRAFATEARVAIREVVAEVRELAPPEEDRQDIERFLDDLDEAAEVLPQIADASERKDTEQVGELVAQLQDKVASAREFADEYGFESCAEASDPQGGKP